MEGSKQNTNQPKVIPPAHAERINKQRRKGIIIPSSSPAFESFVQTAQNIANQVNP